MKVVATGLYLQEIHFDATDQIPHRVAAIRHLYQRSVLDEILYFVMFIMTWMTRCKACIYRYFMRSEYIFICHYIIVPIYVKSIYYYYMWQEKTKTKQYYIIQLFYSNNAEIQLSILYNIWKSVKYRDFNNTINLKVSDCILRTLNFLNIFHGGVEVSGVISRKRIYIYKKNPQSMNLKIL